MSKIKEPLPYRARKWTFQHIPTWRRETQLQRLSDTDWDVLIILDACGVDALKSAAEWPIETVRSPASCTPEWLTAVNRAGVLRDSHIVSANAQYDKVNPGETLERYWKEHWDHSLSTVRPEPVLDRVGKIAGSKQVVAHLQQPHWPYVAKFDSSWKTAYANLGPWEAEDGRIDSVQVAMARGLIDVSSARQAYLASVCSVWQTLIPYVSEWGEQSLTVVVTADHGEVFGRIREFGFYEHPCGCHIPQLVHVPWIEITQQSNTETGSSVEDRLRALGYAE